MGTLLTTTKPPSTSTTTMPLKLTTIVSTIEPPRGHSIGPSHTARLTALNNKLQHERTTHGALEGHIKLQEKEKEYLCVKIARLERQMERARGEQEVQMLRMYVRQQEVRVEGVEGKLFERHGVEYLYTAERARSKRRIVEVDTPVDGRSLSPPKAPRRASRFGDKCEGLSNESKTSDEDGKSSTGSSQSSHPEFVDLSDTSTNTDDEL